MSKKKQTRISIITLILLTIFVGGYIFQGSLKKSKNIKTKTEEPQFTHEGNVEFLDSLGNSFKKIAVEIADTPTEQQTGMMFRTDMPYTQGMFFMMGQYKELSFWMKNCPLSLDIIYVDATMGIVSIATHTQPYSENPILSEGPALFVVEVKAGFCEQFGIKPNQQINFSRL